MARRHLTLALLGCGSLAATLAAAAETCGKDSSGQGIACEGICCPSSGTWTCAPLGATCCYETNRIGDGLYCAAGQVCFDKLNCMPSDSFSTFPATPGTSGNPTAITWTADKTVYDGPIPTTEKGEGGGQVATGTGTKTGKSQGATETGKPNGAAAGSTAVNIRSVMLLAAVVAGAVSVGFTGIGLL